MSNTAEHTAPHQHRVVGRPFKPGQSGNPAGRPRSARSRHTENFLQTFADDFELHGTAVIEKVRTEQPAVYLKIASDLLPRRLDVDLAVEHTVDAERVLLDFRRAVELLQSDRPTPPLKVVGNHGE